MTTVNIEMLRNLPFLEGATPEVVEQFAEVAVERSFQPGQVVFEEDSTGREVYLIIEGLVEVVKGHGAEKMVIARSGPGDFFGEMALIEDRPRFATIRALEPTRLLEFSEHDLRSVLIQQPLLLYQVTRLLSARLRETDLKMIADLQRKNEQLRQAYLDTVTAVANAIEARDPYTRGHTGRVTALARAIAHQMGWSEEQLASLEVGGLLHDVGKIGVADAILRKPASLSVTEYAEIKAHPEVGRRMLQGISYLESAIPGVLYHHERYNGQGYPYQLSGPEIPLAGRIMAVADAFDAMTSDRPYRRAMGPQAAVVELERGAGTQFDPEVVAAFMRAWQSSDLET